MGFYFDSTYILVLIGMAISMWAQHKVTSTFNKYNEWETSNRLSGNQMARTILAQHNITNVSVEHIAGNLTDHYDSRHKVLRLSDATDRQTTIAAVAVAAHECGHALQDAERYAPLKLRSALAPVTQLGSTLAMPLIFIGLMIGWFGIAKIGVAAFSLVLIFQLVTLPVEFDASKRALQILESQQLLTADEMPAAKQVLNAAAMTYIAATLSTALQLFRLILLTNRNSD